MSFKTYLQSKNYTNNTIHGYNKRIEVYIQWMEEEGINIKEARYADLLVYVKYLTRLEHSKHYMNQQLTVIRHYYNYLIKLRKVKDNIATNFFIKGVPRRLPHDILDEEQLDKIYKQFPAKSLINKRNRIILGLIIYQGLTSSELNRLEPSHIQLKEGKISVPGSRRSNTRLLDLKAHQVLDLQEYIGKTRSLIMAMTEKQSPKMFISLGTGSGFNNMMTKMMKTIRVYARQVKSVNQLRASVITHWLGKNNMREVQYMAGHKYVSSTELYQQTNLEDLQKDVNTFHPLK